MSFLPVKDYNALIIMKNTWKPTVAGIFDLFGGILQILSVGVTIVYVALYGEPGDAMAGGIIAVLSVSPLLLTGTIAILGGISAIKRQRFSLALIGCLMALTPGLPLAMFFSWSESPSDSVLISLAAVIAVVSITLTIISRREFENQGTIGKSALRFIGLAMIAIASLQLLFYYSGSGIEFILSNRTLENAAGLMPRIKMLIPFFFFALLALIGGVCAILSKNWWLAMAGVVALILPCLIGLPDYSNLSGQVSYNRDILFVLFGLPVLAPPFLIILLSKEQFVKKTANKNHVS